MSAQLPVSLDHGPEHPEGWRCPWCDRHPVTGEVDEQHGGQAMDYSLPLGLRVCWWCMHPDYCHPRQPRPAEIALWEQIASLRATLRKFIADDWAPRNGPAWGLSPGGHARWAWQQFGAVAVGRSILGALEGLGLDPGDELEAALAAHPGATSGREPVHAQP